MFIDSMKAGERTLTNSQEKSNKKRCSCSKRGKKVHDKKEDWKKTGVKLSCV